VGENSNKRFSSVLMLMYVSVKMIVFTIQRHVDVDVLPIDSMTLFTTGIKMRSVSR